MVKEIDPLCVLDFYVSEACQRQGIGLRLFEFMLEVKQCLPRRFTACGVRVRVLVRQCGAVCVCTAAFVKARGGAGFVCVHDCESVCVCLCVAVCVSARPCVCGGGVAARQHPRHCYLLLPHPQAHTCGFASPPTRLPFVPRLLLLLPVQKEEVTAAQLGYDRPSPKFTAFLAKHCGLRDFTPQANNFVVFKQYFMPGFGALCVLASAWAFLRVARLCVCVCACVCPLSSLGEHLRLYTPLYKLHSPYTIVGVPNS